MVTVEWGFWLVLAMMILMFPFRFVIGILLAACVHELGHLLAIRLTGGKVHRILLNSGGVTMETTPMEPLREVICALSGPGLGALTILAWKQFPEMALAGLVQTVFNLIPIYPLDGGRAVRNICCKIRDFGVQ